MSELYYLKQGKVYKALIAEDAIYMFYFLTITIIIKWLDLKNKKNLS